MSQISKAARKSVLYFYFGIYLFVFPKPAFSENWIDYNGSVRLYCEETGVYSGYDKMYKYMQEQVCWNKARGEYYTDGVDTVVERIGIGFDMDSISVTENLSQINVKIFGENDPDFVIQTTYQADCQSKRLRQINALHVLEPNSKRHVPYNPNWRGAFEYKKSSYIQPSASVESVIFEVACGM